MIRLRPWVKEDAAFVCYMRNNPILKRWYRQSNNITLEDQKKFIQNNPDVLIIENKKVPIGIFWLKPDGEVSLVMEEQNYKYISQLFHRKPTGYYWGEVFVGNPILKHLLEAGFRTVAVTERAYYKPEVGLIDVIRVER